MAGVTVQVPESKDARDDALTASGTTSTLLSSANLSLPAGAGPVADGAEVPSVDPVAPVSASDAQPTTK